jgi:predicted PurR-regulated permease PerM
LSVILLYLVLLGFLLGVSSLLLPLFNAELSTLQSQGPALWKSISSTLTSAPLIGQLIPSTSDASGVISQRFDTLLQGIVAAVGSVGSAGLDVGVVFLLAYFMVVSRDELLAEIQRWIPPSRQAHLQGVGVRVLNGLGDWVRAQPLVMLYFAVGFSVSLSLLHVPFALAIGLVGGLLSVVPFFGAIIAALLGVLSALTVKPVLAIWVLGIITMWTELEVHLIAPALYGRAFRIHPAIVLLVMFVGTKVGGLVGLLFSVPIAVVGMIFLDEIRTPAVPLSAEDRTSSGTR